MTEANDAPENKTSQLIGTLCALTLNKELTKINMYKTTLLPALSVCVCVCLWWTPSSCPSHIRFNLRLEETRNPLVLVFRCSRCTCVSQEAEEGRGWGIRWPCRSDSHGAAREWPEPPPVAWTSLGGGPSDIDAVGWRCYGDTPRSEHYHQESCNKTGWGHDRFKGQLKTLRVRLKHGELVSSS